MRSPVADAPIVIAVPAAGVGGDGPPSPSGRSLTERKDIRQGEKEIRGAGLRHWFTISLAHESPWPVRRQFRVVFEFKRTQ
jgi:hypothetical protein